MKITTKLVLPITVLFTVILALMEIVMFLRSQGQITKDITARSLVLIEVFEATMGTAAGQEDAEGKNAVFQETLQGLTASIPQLEEVNVYRVDLQKVVASTHEEMLGKPVDPEDLEAASTDKGVILFEKEDGRTAIDVTEPLHHAGRIDYVLGVKTDITEDYAEVDGLLLVYLGMGAAGIILGAGFIVWLSRRILRPLSAAAQEIRRLAEGDADLTHRLTVVGRDEVAFLTEQFNLFVAKLHSIVTRLKQSQEEISVVSHQLDSGAQNNAAALEQVSRGLATVLEQASRQSTSTQSSAAAVEEIARNIESLDKYIQEQAQSLGEVSTVTEQMVANIAAVFRSIDRLAHEQDVLNERAEAARAARQSSAQQIDVIEGLSKSLGAANKAIAQVAAQTNLLAMNAAIEAAHAGDAGRGFSVVAGEIRTLAENASRESQSIRRDIKEIEGAIGQLVVTSQNLDSILGSVDTQMSTTRAIVGEVHQAMSEQKVGADQLLVQMSELNGLSEQVRAGSVEMEKGNTTLVGETLQVNQAADLVRANVEEVVRATKQLGEATKESSRLAATSGRAVTSMEEVVGRFRV